MNQSDYKVDVTRLQVVTQAGTNKSYGDLVIQATACFLHLGQDGNRPFRQSAFTFLVDAGVLVKKDQTDSIQ